MKQQENDFEIHVPNNVEGSVVPITWCLSEEQLVDVDDDSVMLITTSPEKTWKYLINRNLENRIVAPVTDGMAFVEFCQGGINAITCVMTSKKDIREFLSGENTPRGYRYNVFEQDYGDTKNKTLPTLDCAFKKDRMKISQARVDVPMDAFPDEPSEREKEWVNWWFRTEPHDECQFKRRRLLAYSIQLIVAFFMIMYRFSIATIVTAFGIKIKPKAVVNLINYTVNDVYKDFDGNMDFWLVLPTKNSFLRYSPMWMFSPGIHILNIIFLGRTGELSQLLSLPIALFALTLVTTIVLLMSSILESIERKFPEASKKINAYVFDPYIKHITSFIGFLAKIQKNRSQRRYEKLRQELLCNATSSKDVSKDPKTIKLKIRKYKAAHCRPYSR